MLWEGPLLAHRDEEKRWGEIGARKKERTVSEKMEGEEVKQLRRAGIRRPFF